MESVGKFQSSHLFVWLIVLILCIGSRLISTIYYIEDLDSLRFALSMVEYNVSKLQPHFPAYPIFCFVAKLFYILIGRYTLTFSLIGGISTFFTIFWTLKIAKINSTTIFGKIAIFVIFMTPLLWLMSNRYMPDLMGVACLLASLYFLTKQEESDRNNFFCCYTIGFFLTGILLGIRLSYGPLLLPALLIGLRHSAKLKAIIAITIGTLIWLIPLLWITGWETLIAAAQTQGEGHFADFGGTVSTHPNFLLRFAKIIESIFADGFGLYWHDRHLITACTTIILCGIVVFSNRHKVKRYFAEKTFGAKSFVLNPIFLGCTLYLIWIFFAQNVIYKSRHVLPLLPFLALGIASSCHRIVNFQRTERAVYKKRRAVAWGIVVLCGLCYSYVTLRTVVEHTRPTAIAQIHQYIRDKQNVQDNSKLDIVSVPLIKYYLASQGVEADYITIKNETDLAQIGELETGVIVIGGPLPNQEPIAEKIFYHNPYVNRMWSELSLFEY